MEEDKEKNEKNDEIPYRVEPMDNMPQAEPMPQNIVEDKFVPVEEHVDTPFVVDKSSYDSIESVKESIKEPMNVPTTEIPPIPLVPVLGEMKDDMYSMENNTRKKRKNQTNKKTKRRRRCKKGSRRNKRTRRCRKNKKRV
jgi:hypothetical protein